MSNYVADIDKFPHLKRRLDYELRRLGNNCQNCEIKRVYNKYRDIISKELARQEQVTKRKINRS